MAIPIGTRFALPALPAAEIDSTVKDTVIVGDGISAKFVTAATLGRLQKLPRQQRYNPANERGNFEVMMIGRGHGRAYTARRGLTGNASFAPESVNLMRHQMSYRAGNVAPADENFLKHSAEPSLRRIAGQKPFAFLEPYTDPDTGHNYALVKPKDQSFSLDNFVHEHYPEHADEIGTPRHILGDYSDYIVRKELERTGHVGLKRVEAQVSDIDYDLDTKLFTLQLNGEDGSEPVTIRARHVILATGLESDVLPPFLRDVAQMHNVHSGENIFGEFLHTLNEQFAANPQATQAAWQKKKGLIIGSGLTMNDAALGLLSKNISNFEIVSRHALTHELPRDLPPMPELEVVADDIDELLDFQRLRYRSGFDDQHSDTPTEARMVKQIEHGFKAAKRLAEQYVCNDDEPVEVNGEVYPRQSVSTAVLSQYVAFQYEKARSALRDTFGDERAEAIGAGLLAQVDLPFSAWLTTVRTSTTNVNLHVNRYLRHSGTLRAGEVEKVVAEDGRFRVSFATPAPITLNSDEAIRALDQRQVASVDPRSGATRVTFKRPPDMLVDYILNCAGRESGAQPPGKALARNSALTDKLFQRGLIIPHGVGVGVAMDRYGKAISDPQRFGNDAPQLYVVSPFLAKGDQYLPANRRRHPLSNTIAESVLGLRPLTKQVAKAVVYDMVKWSPDEGYVEYHYQPDGVRRISENQSPATDADSDDYAEGDLGHRY